MRWSGHRPMTDMAYFCATCGAELGDDPEDEPTGDADLPICGECNRSRNFDAIEEVVLWQDDE